MLSKINDAYESVKNGLEAQVALATAEQKEKLADAKLALADLKGLIADLKDENRALKEQVSIKGEYQLDLGVYWKTDDSEKSQPFCPVCYAKGNVIPLRKLWDGYEKTRTPWTCPDAKCGATLNPWDYRDLDDTGIVTPSGGYFSMDDRY